MGMGMGSQETYIKGRPAPGMSDYSFPLKLLRHLHPQSPSSGALSAFIFPPLDSHDDLVNHEQYPRPELLLRCNTSPFLIIPNITSHVSFPIFLGCDNNKRGQLDETPS